MKLSNGINCTKIVEDFYKSLGNPKWLRQYISTCDLVIKETGEKFGTVPLITMPEDSDYRWQLGALQDRLIKPENYIDYEDIQQTINKLIKWLSEHEDKHPELKARRLNGYYGHNEKLDILLK